MLPPLTARNGQLTTAELATVEGGPRGPQALRVDAWVAYVRCEGDGMPYGCLRSGYRDLTEQDGLYADYLAGGGMAARPRTSYHGEGLASDVDEPARSWLHRYGAAYGWVANTVAGEPWHFVYAPDTDKRKDRTVKVDLSDEAKDWLRLLLDQRAPKDLDFRDEAGWNGAELARKAAQLGDQIRADVRLLRAEVGQGLDLDLDDAALLASLSTGLRPVIVQAVASAVASTGVLDPEVMASAILSNLGLRREDG